jgi:hypothetical protein
VQSIRIKIAAMDDELYEARRMIIELGAKNQLVELELSKARKKSFLAIQ